MSPSSRGLRAARANAARFGRWLVPLIYASSLGAFVSDLMRANALAYGLMYTPLVSTAVFFRNRRIVWVLSGTATAMVVIGAFFPVIDPDVQDVFANRILSIIAIFATAIFVRHARDIQDRLAAERRRAEAAEQIKSELLTNLSNEMRTPLHGLLGVLQLMAANARPDQREALRHVGGSAQQLLSSLDNLVDLTRLDEHQLRPRPMDIRILAEEAAERARFAAAERQVTIALKHDDTPLTALADEWAAQRVLDNLLANAISGTPAGGTVSLLLDRSDGLVAIAVSDPRLTRDPDLAHSLASEAGIPEADIEDDADAAGFSLIVGTGLTLAQRLARGMGGRLRTLDHPEAGPVLALSLPEASSVSG